MENIDLYTLRILVSVGLLILAGLSRAIFECIIFFDTPKKYLGDYYSRDLFYSNKDRNNDGKISYFENAFPNDGGHRIKIAEISCLIVSGIGFIGLNFYQSAIYIIAAFLIYSYSFEQFFKKYRK
jgi:hypothetical protein